MTVIAWDGKTLCADKRATSADMPVTVTKIFRLEQGLVGFDGDLTSGMALLNWFKKGCIPNEFIYDAQKDDTKWCYAVLITPDKEIKRFGYHPYPYIVEDGFFAVGSGRDYAMAALHCGKTSREAVEIACRYNVGCGNGIDELAL